MKTFARPLRCLSILIIAAHSHIVVAQWVKAPSKELLDLTPGLVHETFNSVSMATTVGYSVVLPPGYESSIQRYPVVYWLHGGGGNECSSLFTAKSWSDLYEADQVKPVILVYPNGFRSGYMDHHDGKVMIESMIIRELVPRIDTQYRTIATRAGRAVHGFSMGSSGALKFTAKYPQLFGTAVAYGGGAVDLEHTESRFVLDILERNLKSDPNLIQQNNSYHFLEKNHDILQKNDLRVLLICGDDDSWKESAVTYRAALQQKGIPCQIKIVPEVGHNLRGLMAAEGESAAKFQDRAFREALAHESAAALEKPATATLSYDSKAEGRSQGFQVTLPPGFRQETPYPLFVQVSGGADLLPTRERPFIRIRPSGRGVWGYRSMSRYDIMQAIDQTKKTYSIDENRVYITGASAGATGVMHAAAQRSDVFAGIVPLVAFGNDLPLENFCNLPIQCEHGINDWTSAIGNVRVQFKKLRKLGYDAKLNEHPTAGHGIRVPPPATMDWLFDQKRDPSPRQIVYSCEHPRDGRAYWLKIENFADPHQIARVEVSVRDGLVNLNAQNVDRFSIDLSTAPAMSQHSITIDGEPVSVGAGPDASRWAFVKDNKWRHSPADAAQPSRLPYGAGAAANLFQGEPLLVVYGTGADENENRFLQKAATVLASSGGPTYKAASVRFPISTDNDASDMPLGNYNLLLVGTSQNNSVLRGITGQLPYTIEDGVLTAADRKPLKLDDSVLGFHYFNPEHPGRTIYVVSPLLDEEGRKRFLQNPRLFLAGSDGFKMIDQPDLYVRGTDLRIRREMQFDSKWEFIDLNGADQPVPGQFSERVHLATAHMKVMHQSASVDFAFWWGPEDKGLFGGYDFNWLPTFDPTVYTAADYAVRHRETETMTATLSGEELLDIHKRWIATRELVTWPPLSHAKIDVDGHYSIVIPMDLVPKLGNRRKILSNVSEGPSIMPAQVASRIFTTE
jgi:predicted peptidase